MTIDLLKYLRAQGHEVVVYAKQIPKAYTYDGFDVERSVYLRRDISQTFDVLLTHAEIRTSVITNANMLPYVAVVHNVAGATMRSLERQAPTLTIANSEYTRDHIPSNAKHHALGVHVIRPPVLLDPVDNGPHDRIGIVNVSIDKGGDVLKYVAEKNPSIKFLAVQGGHGVQVESLPSNVEVVAQTPDMASQYARMRALIFPTRSETYGKVAAEATQFGVPLIVSDIPPLHEVCGDAAIYLDPHDYEEWNYAVRSMMKDNIHAKWSRLSSARGEQLRGQSLEDLERFERLLLEAAELRER